MQQISIRSYIAKFKRFFGFIVDKTIRIDCK